MHRAGRSSSGSQSDATLAQIIEFALAEQLFQMALRFVLRRRLGGRQIDARGRARMAVPIRERIHARQRSQPGARHMDGLTPGIRAMDPVAGGVRTPRVVRKRRPETGRLHLPFVQVPRLGRERVGPAGGWRGRMPFRVVRRMRRSLGRQLRQGSG